MPRRMIRNLADLAEHLGCDPTEASVARRVYKDTACGAWFKEALHQEASTSRRRWSASVHHSIAGPVLTGFRPEHGRTVAPADAPAEVRQFFQAKEVRAGLWIVDGMTWDEVTMAGDPCKVQLVRQDLLRLTAPVEVRRARQRLAVLVGSIVEGVEAEVEPDPLPYPFTAGQWEATVQAVEDRADEIWKETHGCEQCFGRTDGEASGPVDPDCPGCHGDGIVL